MTDNKPSSHAQVALALAALVRNDALEAGTHREDVNYAGGDHDQWLEWYECGLGWAALEWEPRESLEGRLTMIVKNMMGRRWARPPRGSC